MAIRLLYVISLIGLVAFFSLFFWYSSRKPEELKRKRMFLIGLVLCFLAFCVTAILKVARGYSATPSVTVARARMFLWGLLDVLAGVLYFRNTRLYEIEDPVEQKKFGRGTQKIGFLMMLLSVALSLTSI